MDIKNATRNKVLESNFEVCDGVVSKAIGLMFSKKRKFALVFKFTREKIIALHMFFVFYPIDVLFLDKDRIVVDMKENFMPFTFYRSKKQSMYAIELPNGSIKNTRTRIGDRIEF